MLIRLEDLLTRTISLDDTSCENILKTISKRLKDVLKMSWRCFRKTSWRRFEGIWPRPILVLTKASSEGAKLRRIYSSWSRRLEDVFWRRKRKTSSEDDDERRLLETKTKDVFIKKNVCWVISKLYFRFITNGTDLVKCSYWKRCFIKQLNVPEWHILWFVSTHN